MSRVRQATCKNIRGCCYLKDGQESCPYKVLLGDRIMSNKTITNRRLFISMALASVLLLLASGAVFAQTTSFTYQGKLTDGGTGANGNYDLQFTLFDSAAG